MRDNKNINYKLQAVNHDCHFIIYHADQLNLACMDK